MGKNKLDDFLSPEKISKTWDEDIDGEAVCSICDSVFTPVINRPPIFCPECKQALKEFMFTKLR